MKIARHEDAVAMLTGGLSYVTLVVVREKVINKRMLPLSKLQEQSGVNKRLGTKVRDSGSFESPRELSPVCCAPLSKSITHEIQRYSNVNK